MSGYRKKFKETKCMPFLTKYDELMNTIKKGFVNSEPV